MIPYTILAAQFCNAAHTGAVIETAEAGAVFVQPSGEALWAQVLAFGPAPFPLADLQALAIARVNAEYERRMGALSVGYPPTERESWPVQTSEARALLADPEASTPWIDAAAIGRGLARADLAARIVALDDQYRTVHGTLTGLRQRLEGEIRAATTAEAIAAVGWPAP